MAERKEYINLIADLLERIGSDTFIKRVYALVKNVYTCEGGMTS